MKQLLKNIGFYLAFQLGVTLLFMLIFIKSQPFVSFGVSLIIGGLLTLIVLGPKSSKGVSGKTSVIVDALNDGMLSANSWSIIREYSIDKERAEQMYSAVPTERELAKGYEVIDKIFARISGFIGLVIGFFIFMMIKILREGIMLSLFCFSDDRWSPLHSLWGICGTSRAPFPTQIVQLADIDIYASLVYNIRKT